MDKVARIHSIDFHSEEAKIEFRKGIIEWQKQFPEIELIISVETSDESLMSISFGRINRNWTLRSSDKSSWLALTRTSSAI